MRRRAAPARAMFPVNVWPPMVDVLTLVLAVFVLLTAVAAIAQRGLLRRLRERDQQITALNEEKSRVEKRLRALGVAGAFEVEEGKVILQGEVLFDSGSDELKPAGRAFLQSLAAPLAGLLASEPDQMVLVGGHTDNKPLRGTGRFASNWELSAARAVAVSRVLVEGGLPPGKVAAAGFADNHPRAPNTDDASRRRNRRIEVLIVPVHSVASR